MHIAQRKELAVHKTKEKGDRNRTTSSLVLDSSMLHVRGRRKFRLKPANLVAFNCQYLRAAEYIFKDISCYICPSKVLAKFWH